MALKETLAPSTDSARESRYRAQRVQWSESSIDAVRACGHHAVTDAGISVRHSVDSAGKRSAGFSGLSTCGSVWACAVCNHKIATKRADEVAQAIRTWEGSAAGRYVVMVTQTMRHYKGQSLTSLWDGLSYGWSKATSGRTWADLCETFGAVDVTPVPLAPRGRRIPWVRFTEVTLGDNGWHVHVHALLFLEEARGKVAAALAGLAPEDCIGRAMFSAWTKALVRRGFDAPIRDSGGLDVRRFAKGAEEVGKYLTKSTFDHANRAGWEAAGGAMKKGRRGGRTPFQILASVVDTGDADDLDLWHEWEKGSRGRRQVAWARGFREWLALEVELTDEEIAAEELDGETLGWIDPGEWKFLRARKSDLLRAAETLPLEVLREVKPWHWLALLDPSDPEEIGRQQGLIAV